MEDFNIYTSTSKCKRPNDDLIESECARFKVSGADFGIISLTEIKRFLTISPVIQFAFFDSEKNAQLESEKWKEKIKDSVFANFIKNTQSSPSSPENIMKLIETIQEKIPDKFPGRLPSISVLDPEGGFWTSTAARTISSMSPIFCPTVRFDLNPPELYYSLGSNNRNEDKPSVDSASHAYLFAGLEFLGSVINIPIRPKNEEKISLITDGDLLINDLNVSDFILGQILDENIWKNKNDPFIISFGTANTMILSRKHESILDMLRGDFFVQYE